MRSEFTAENLCSFCGCRKLGELFPGIFCTCTDAQKKIGQDVVEATEGKFRYWQIEVERETFPICGKVVLYTDKFLLVKTDNNFYRTRYVKDRCKDCAGHLAGFFTVEETRGLLRVGECTNCHSIHTV
jgi:hypothetical protein